MTAALSRDEQLGAHPGVDTDAARAVPERLRVLLPALADLVANPVEVDEWVPAALCRTDDKPDRWFPEMGVTAQYARRVCAVCPVRLRCLAEAARADERYGVWGGAIPAELAPVRVALGLNAEQGGATDEACAQGHPWTEDTLGYTAAGTRVCRECNRIAKRDERRRARGSQLPTASIPGSRARGRLIRRNR